MTGQKQDFSPNGPVKMYVCGVTPYDDSHIGHAMSAIVFDVVRRYLEFRGHEVQHVVNFTDVDDKIIARAERLGIGADDLAQQHIDKFMSDLASLNVQRATKYPRVTEEIDSIIELVGKLEERGFAYASAGDVYFRVDRCPDYGKLSHRVVDDMLAGARVEVGETKEAAADFALWKGAKPGEPQWESPWGPGRPGWHIECSAMAMTYLGETLDIHGGGQDLIFPHHENEIAQSECATGVRPFSRFWLHNGLLRLGEEKMSKSLGNLVTIGQVLEKQSADALRLFVLTSHYRSPLTYTEEALQASERGAERLREALRTHVGQALPEPRRRTPVQAVDPEPFATRFFEAMEDDFNTAQAVAALFDLAREINRGRETGANAGPAQERLQALAGVLGLTLEGRASSMESDAGPFIDLLIQLRAELRTQKNYALADTLREQLAERGVLIEDTAQGTLWRRR
jgi:cysteinyl-tRNA synthetase